MTEGDEGEQVRSDEWDSNRWYAYYYTINKNTLQAAFSSDSPRQSDGSQTGGTSYSYSVGGRRLRTFEIPSDDNVLGIFLSGSGKYP